MTIRWVVQPEGMGVCGQVAIAALTGLPLSEVYELVGHKHGTKTRELVRVLRGLGFITANNCRSRVRPWTGLAQVHQRHRYGGWHWVALDGERIYDGVNGKPDGTVEWPDNWRMTSYCEVRGPGG